VTPSYGSGQHGLICGYVFAGAASGRDIGLEDALRWLQPGRDGDEGGSLWLHLNVGGIPRAESAHGFLVVVLIVVTFTLVAGWLAFHKRD